jgi:hypothetical protein
MPFYCRLGMQTIAFDGSRARAIPISMFDSQLQPAPDRLEAKYGSIATVIRIVEG